MTAPVINRPQLADVHVSPLPAVSEMPAIPSDQAATWADVARTQAGDGAAFGRIYAQYAHAVFKFINARVKHTPTAEDLTSDVFLRAFRRIGMVTWQGRDLAAWLLTIARNVVTDFFKSRKRSEVLLGDVSYVSDADFDRTALDTRPVQPDAPVLARLDHDVLLAAIAALTPPQREVIRYRFLEQLSTAETCARMGKNTGAIKALQCRAMKNLALNEQVRQLWDLDAGPAVA